MSDADELNADQFPQWEKIAGFVLVIDRPDLPNVRGWYDRLRCRPAYAQTVMIPLT